MTKKPTAPKRQTAQANPRPANEFCFCLRCARWGSRSPDPDCSHVERVDLTGATSTDVEFFEELAERIARQREQMRLGFSMLRNDAKRLVNQGKARTQDIHAPPSSGIVRLMKPDPRDPIKEPMAGIYSRELNRVVKVPALPANKQGLTK